MLDHRPWALIIRGAGMVARPIEVGVGSGPLHDVEVERDRARAEVVAEGDQAGNATSDAAGMDAGSSPG